MPSSPSQGSQKSPKRSTPRRTPLQERSQSQTNELSVRKTRDTKEDGEISNVVSTTPFPTKPAHVLLPSVLRKQRNGQSAVPEFLLPNNSSSSSLGPKSPTSPGARRPQVRLKRSVKTLRDMYEAQAEESRPSTATSGRPSSAASSRLRSASSSEALSGRNAWEVLSKISSDDLALLPSLAEGSPTLQHFGSKSSFATRAAGHAATSSPNYRILDVSSSPKIPVFKDLPSPELQPSEPTASTPDTILRSSSSPNVVRLGQTSSLDQLRNVEGSSSPNFIKLSTSSPQRDIRHVQSSTPESRRSSMSSNSSRKRKRGESEEVPSKLARGNMEDPFTSSPPIQASGALSSETDSSSPPYINAYDTERSPSLDSDMVENSSPVVRLVRGGEIGFDGNSAAETHASLQAALTSSPAPPIQYPVVRAPASSQVAGLAVAKRYSRSSHLSSVAQRLSSRFSLVRSESTKSKTASKGSSYAEDDLDDVPSSASSFDDMYPVPESVNNSQIRIISDDDQHEASDEISALPEAEYNSHRSPTLRPIRSIGYLSSPNTSQSRLNSLCNSLDNRLNSMRSFTQSRHDSIRSSGQRPLSSSSAMSTFAVPTWARRYYSGFYNDTFQQLYASTSNVTLYPNYHPQPQPQPQPQPSSRPDTSTSRQSHRSFVSLRDSLTEHIPAVFRPKNRPRLEARKSHTLPGSGPLVSNPVRGPATAAMTGNLRSHPDHRSTIRPVSLPLHPADPRAHWAGIVIMPEKSLPHNRSTSDNILGNSRNPQNPRMPWIPTQASRMSRIPSSSPHLHHDHRLNTGSSASRGFGYPFNRKSRWSAPNLSSFLDQNRPTSSASRRHRVMQVSCFIAGFVLPLTWFVGAILPLPKRPSAFGDMEKAQYAAAARPEDQDHTDLLTKLRQERQTRGLEEMEWQGTRWWRTLNRYMCAIGAVVIIAIIILAILGTKQNW